MGKFIANTEQREKSFASIIREIEPNNKLGIKISSEMYQLGEFLFNENAYNAIAIFNWLGDSSLKAHEKDGKRYVEIISSERNLKIMETFKQVFLDRSFGVLSLRHLHAQGVFIRNNGKTVWQYPAYSRRNPNSFDVKTVIKKAAESISWGI